MTNKIKTGFQCSIFDSKLYTPSSASGNRMLTESSTSGHWRLPAVEVLPVENHKCVIVLVPTLLSG